MIVLQFSMQGEDLFENINDKYLYVYILEHIIGKCHVFIFSMHGEDILEHIIGKCHLCTYFSQLVDHCVT